MKRHVWLPALLLASASAAQSLPARLEAGVGTVAMQQFFLGGAWTDGFGAAYVNAQASLSWVGLDADALLTLPFGGLGPNGGVTLTARAGYQGDRLTVLAGPVAQYGFGATPAVQWLPSIRARYRFDGWALNAGLFDIHALALAHVTAELGPFAIGYVAPVGGLLRYRLRNASLPVALTAELLVASVASERHALFTLAATYGDAP